MEDSRFKTSQEWCNVITQLTLSYQQNLKLKKERYKAEVVPFPSRESMSSESKASSINANIVFP